MDEPASSAVNFYNFSDGAAFAATATQEDNLLGGGSSSDAEFSGGSASNVKRTEPSSDRSLRLIFG